MLAALAIAAGGCEAGSEAEPPPRDAVAAVRDAAARTLAAGPASLAIRVSSNTAAYSLRGDIDLTTEVFRVRARVAKAPSTHFPNQLKVIGVDGETYQIVDRDLSFENVATGCAFDPHAPIGSLGGAASMQEAVALVGIAARLVRDAPRGARLVRQSADRAATYRVIVNPRAVTDPNGRRGDEWIVVNPPRLAGHLAPMLVTVDANGMIRRLSLVLRRFPPPSRGPGPGMAREHRRERVSISVSLDDSGRELEVKRPSCVAME